MSTCPWPPRLPAVEAAAAEIGAAGAVDAVAGARHARLERGERHGHLEGRARGVGAGDGLVRQRPVLVARAARSRSPDLMPKTKLLGSNPGAEASATMSPFVTSITTAAALCPAMRRMAKSCSAEVDRQVHVLAGGALDPAELAHHPAAGADLDLQVARHAAQRRPPAAARRRSCRSGSGGSAAPDRGSRILARSLSADRADVADHVRGRVAARVVAAEADLGDHARAAPACWRRPAPRRPRSGARRPPPARRRCGRASPSAPARACRRQLDDAGEPRQHRLGVARLLAHHHDAVVLPVARHQPAGAVEIMPRAGGIRRMLMRFSSASSR